jgi:type VI protein secretion system component VasF
MDVLNNILNNWQSYLGALSAVLVAAIAVSAMIPGEEPEATLQKIVDFIARFSKK